MAIHRFECIDASLSFLGKAAENMRRRRYPAEGFYGQLHGAVHFYLFSTTSMTGPPWVFTRSIAEGCKAAFNRVGVFLPIRYDLRGRCSSHPSVNAFSG